jgi:membrane associated rhomboid family serine protease
MFTLPLYDDNPTATTPIVNWTIIAICVAVFLWQAGLPPREAQAAIYSYGLVPAVLFGFAELPRRLAVIPPEATVITSMFLHGGWMHLIGNMLFLWIFGDNVEEALGHARYLLFYLLCGIAAALGQALAGPEVQTPMVGASGAIAGVLGAYFVLLPRARVLTVIFFGIILIREIPAIWFLGIWIGLQIWSGGFAILHPQSGGGTAFFAHIGGFVFGAATVLLIAKRRPTAPASRYPVW